MKKFLICWRTSWEILFGVFFSLFRTNSTRSFFIRGHNQTNDSKKLTVILDWKLSPSYCSFSALDHKTIVELWTCLFSKDLLIMVHSYAEIVRKQPSWECKLHTVLRLKQSVSFLLLLLLLLSNFTIRRLKNCRNFFSKEMIFGKWSIFVYLSISFHSNFHIFWS